MRTCTVPFSGLVRTGENTCAFSNYVFDRFFILRSRNNFGIRFLQLLNYLIQFVENTKKIKVNGFLRLRNKPIIYNLYPYRCISSQIVSSIIHFSYLNTHPKLNASIQLLRPTVAGPFSSSLPRIVRLLGVWLG